MKAWRTITILLIVAVAAAFAWHWLAADPGYVQIRVRGTTIETSVVAAIAMLIVFWAAVSILWWLLRFPFRAWGRAVQRRGRERLAGGLTAFAEGDYAQAERELGKVANQPAFRTPALLVLARAAHERGENERAERALADVDAGGARAADGLRARFLLERGRAAEALSLLKSKAANGLSQRGRRALIDAALADGDTQAALDALPAFAKSQSLTPEAQAALETRVLDAALAAAPDATRLNTLWNGATRAQRRRPELIAAFARRSAALGQTLAAMDEIESALRREWSEDLAALYAELGPNELPSRTTKAEGWLAIAPNSPALLTTIGRLYVQQEQWTKAEEPLERALGLAESPAAWEALGDCRRGEGDLAAACTCYANALQVARGLASTPVGARLPRGPLDTRPVAFEERSEHGVPRLPVAK
ncbi:heme biosynthesis HemY N-terminal domain-containing protein [Dokdonella sp.]|uniref:heme biosynthesis HemY N-terminal domain-containing protein n=1 Tax=Dokdonella sp. TaxID=2291710 RepID=UPI001B28DC93|nr:heme biosynthesis HemY N-terminal domain-containing protein [Dokdonella sp.]MBO9661380.1 heme biosynthesis protein HemY [Dokdonella sp.]